MPVYAKGLVLPQNLDQLHQDSWQAYGKALVKLPDVTAPTWDCRKLGLVGAIKNQGQCGSCWDFSGTGVIEGALVKAGVGPADQIILSEQYTLDCGRNGGCNGDDNSNVCDWAKNTGLPLTKDYGQYQGGPANCHGQGLTMYKIDNWGYCDQSSGIANTQSIKNAMAAFGPIGAAIAADDAFMNIRSGTVFQGSGSQAIDHDIILIGWDDSKGAWLLRNSWGTNWVDGGYCWIKYGANMVGYAALWAVKSPSMLDWFI